MQNWRKIVLLSSPLDQFNVKQAALNAFYSIYLDYFDHLTFSEFEKSHMYNESVVMKAAAYRFLTPEIQEKLFRSSIEAGGLSSSLYSFHPIFYLRITKPVILEGDSRPLLDSQPHFDRAFDVSAFSFWLALEAANTQTGGLCFFSEEIDEFSIAWGESNKYNYDGYLSNHTRLDEIIRSKIVYPSLSTGQAYMFDSETLHAATRGFTQARVSFDFRLVHRDNLIGLDSRSESIFKIAGTNIALANAANLKILGDDIGAARYVQLYNVDEGTVGKIVPQTDIRLSDNKMAWRTEYCWIESIPSSQ